MKITFRTSEILPQLTQVTSVVVTKNVAPVLQNLHVIMKEKSMILTGSDSEIWITERATVMESEEDCVFCIPALDFLSVVRNIGDAVVTMNFDREKKSVTCDYGVGTMTMPFESADDYPKPHAQTSESQEVLVDSAKLLKAISLTEMSISNNEIRPIMNVVHFEFAKGYMLAASCEFNKMVKYIDSSVNHDEADTYVLNLPKKPALLADAVLSTVEGLVKVSIAENIVTISNSQFKLTARLVNGNYPDVTKAIPRYNNIKVEVHRADLIHAVKRVSSMNGGSSHVILNFCNEYINVYSEDVMMGKCANEEVSCNTNTDVSLEMMFNSNYLIEVLKNLDDEYILFCVSEPFVAAIIKPLDESDDTEYTSILMPMKPAQPCSTANT